MQRANLKPILSAFLLTGLVVAVNAAEPVGWRMDGTGRFPQSRPPVEWSPDKNVIWKTPLDGRSHASPVLLPDRILVLAEPADLICLDRSGGTPLWQAANTWTELFGEAKAAVIAEKHEQAKAIEQQQRQLKRELGQLKKDTSAPEAKIEELKGRIDELGEQIDQLTEYPRLKRNANGNTTATPVSDGRFVYAVFGTGIVSSYTLDGRLRWMVFVEPPASGFGHSSSPVLADGKLIVHFDSLTALDASTGKTVWQIPAGSRFGSLLTANIGNTPAVITSGGAVVAAGDGRMLAENLFRLGHSSPMLYQDRLYAMPSGRCLAIQLPESTAPDALQFDVVWEGPGMRQRRFASPLWEEGLVFGVTEKAILDVTDARTGELVYRKRLDFGGGRVYPSPASAGGLVYLSSDNGATIILRPGREYDEVARNELEPFSSCPVFDGDRMFVRTKKHLYCIGKRP